MRVLLVEDNEVHQVIVLRYLERIGAEVATASNGIEAVNVLKNTKYDIVLMDVDMPVMNGLTATRVIRDMISEKIPIIALTGLTGEEDRRACKEAGMDAFLGKPLNVNDLVAALEKYTEHNQKGSAAGQKGGSGQDLYDLSKLRAMAEGDEVFVQRMVKLFIEKTDAHLVAIRENYSLGAYDRVGSIAHKMKPSIDTINVEKLKSVVRDLEKCAKDPERCDKLEPLINSLEAIGRQVIDQLRLIQ